MTVLGHSVEVLQVPYQVVNKYQWVASCLLLQTRNGGESDLIF